MNREEIIEMATKVYGECKWHESALQHLQIFAQLVAEKEREKCAKVCEELVIEVVGNSALAVNQCVKTIRARE
jgi:hypothetical protein